MQEIPPDQKNWGQRLAGITHAESVGESPFVDRPAWQRIAGLIGTIGISLSALGLAAGFATWLGVESIPSIGLALPFAGLIGSLSLAWRFRSRRRYEFEGEDAPGSE